MKQKLRNLMAVSAAIVGCWSSNAWAQDLANGSYYIKNVKTGKFLVGGNSWGTQASLGRHGIDFILNKVGNEMYTLDSQISNGGNNHYLGSNGYVDGTAANMIIAGDGNGVYTITADGSTFLSSNADNTVVAFDATADSEYAQWQFLTREEMFALLDDATSENPVDATFFVKGQNFGRNDTRNGAWFGSPVIGGANENMCAERYNMAFDVYQNVTGVPAGKYKLYCQGFFRYGGAAAALAAHIDGSEVLETKLYANDSEASLMSIFNEDALKAIRDNGITEGKWSTGTIDGVEYKYPNDMTSASAAFSAGLYKTSLDVVVGETGAIKMGFKKETTNVPNGNWTIFDNFEIYYLGLDDEAIAAAKTAMANLQNEAKALYDSPMNADVLAQLKAQVQASDLADAPKPSEIAAKTANLNDAIATANTSIAAYKTLKAAIDKANKIVNSVYIYKEEDKTIYTNAIEEAEAAYTNGTYTDAQAAEMQKKLWNTDHQSGTLLARPFISSVWSGGVYTNNWSVEADNKANGSGMTTPFIEYWTGDANSLGANEIKAELSGIEAGFYKIEALVRVRIKDYSTETPHGITMQANGASTTDVCNGKTCDDGPQFRYDVYSTVCEVKEDGTLAIVFNVAEENNISWLSFKEVKYMETTAKVEDIAVKVSAEYGTMILPFDAEIPSGMEVYSVNSCSEQTEEYSVLSLQPVTDKITANIPYIVKSDATDFTFNGIVLSKENTSKGWLTGVMTDTPAPLGSYVLQKQDKLGLGFYLVETDDIIVPAHRAYLTIPETSAANVRAFVFDLGNATGINHVEVADALVNVYSIDGVPVRKAVKASEALNGLRKGVYVVNGVKKAVK